MGPEKKGNVAKAGEESLDAYIKKIGKIHHEAKTVCGHLLLLLSNPNLH